MTAGHNSHAQHASKLEPLNQVGLAEVNSKQTDELKDQEIVLANQMALDELRDEMKCFVDKLLWCDFEGSYIGMKNHMTFRSDIYLPR